MLWRAPLLRGHAGRGGRTGRSTGETRRWKIAAMIGGDSAATAASDACVGLQCASWCCNWTSSSTGKIFARHHQLPPCTVLIACLGGPVSGSPSTSNSTCQKSCLPERHQLLTSLDFLSIAIQNGRRQDSVRFPSSTVPTAASTRSAILLRHTTTHSPKLPNCPSPHPLHLPTAIAFDSYNL